MNRYRVRAVAAFVALGLCAAATVQASIAGWRQPQTLVQHDSADSVGSPLVAIDGRGSAVAAWSVRPLSGTGPTGAVAERRAGAAWSTPRPLSSAPRALAVNGRGDALVTWVEPSLAANRLAFSHRQRRGAWQQPVFVAGGGPIGRVNVVLDEGGGAVAVWEAQRAPGDQVIRAAARPAGGTWSRARTLGPGQAPQVGVARDGRALAVWTHYCRGAVTAQCRSAGLVVRAAARTTRGRWTRPRTLSSLVDDEAILFDVEVNPEGAAVVAWKTMRMNPTGPPSRGITVVVGTVSGAFGRPQVLRSGFVDSADVAVAVTGEAVAVWSSPDPSDATAELVYAASRHPGRAFGAPKLVGDGFEPAIGTDGRGAAIAAWTRSDGTNLFVQAAQRRSGGPFGRAVDLAPVGLDCTRHRGCGSEVAVAVAAGGRAHAVWLAHEAFNHFHLQAAEYVPGRG